MDPIPSKYSVWKRILHKFQARRDIPFRKNFFVGYDLHGNTYWEFTLDGNMQRLRRKMEPYTEYMFKADYFTTVPPQWLQWLRRTRNTPPSLHELIEDQMRQQNIKMLAQQANDKWETDKQLMQKEQQLKLQRELDKIKDNEPAEADKSEAAEPEVKAGTKEDPWAQADKAQEPDYNPIQPAKISIRK